MRLCTLSYSRSRRRDPTRLHSFPTRRSSDLRPATELGVKRFVTFVSTNCEARELSAVKLSRLRRVAQEAARQSGRSVVPTVEERSEEHTSELQSRENLVCRLLLEQKKDVAQR